MSKTFKDLPQLVDHRKTIPAKGSYSKRVRKITDRVWHHSLTKKHLGGSDAASFARYHISLGWPGVGYTFIIEPKNIVNTSNGKRARIVYANDINNRTYHVGNSNQFSLGICVAGDYRTDEMDEATKASISELHAALVADGIGNKDKSHHEMPGYRWKACCVYNYKEAFKFLSYNKPAVTPPKTYKIQEGDTFWGIAHNNKGITVNDLIAANPDVKPTQLKIGQIINLGKAENAYTSKPTTPKKPQDKYKYPMPGQVLLYGAKGEDVKKLQRALNAIYFRVGKVDGSYGPLVKDAVERFQSVYLPYEIDGKFGPNTRKKLQAVLKSRGM